MTPDLDAAHGLATHYLASEWTPEEMGEGEMMRYLAVISEAYLELYEAHRVLRLRDD